MAELQSFYFHMFSLTFFVGITHWFIGLILWNEKYLNFNGQLFDISINDTIDLT